ncbi:hypothetical protein MSAN_02383400 [Mycena sanguinolenta]|uniref:DUF6533 domain-containing protein n=1 Tax=Mycena sanguinolenta TaxID=230812 RepID=A0A8H6X4W6_9AGAR|nr:hypothetical protein MSAN_02383400 [Mycena sanguinolenta]
MADTTELPNPFTPLAFLSPALASQFETSRYVFVATLGAYVWDIGLNLGDDYALLFKHRFRFTTLVYFLSRAFTLAYILTASVLQVAPVENCNALLLGFGICSVLTQTTTATLFFVRVTAVWHPSKIAYAVFSILLLAVLAGGIIVPLKTRGAHIGTTMQCITTDVPPTLAVAAIMPLINDTAVFLAINYRILTYTIVANSSTARLRVFLGGEGLSALSRGLLQSGQHFYLVAVAANVTFIIVLILPNFSPVYRGMLSIPALALTNAMACIVFRRIKFGLISSDGVSKIPTTGLSSDYRTTTHSRSLPLHYRGTDHTITEFATMPTLSMNIQVQREVDKF